MKRVKNNRDVKMNMIKKLNMFLIIFMLSFIPAIAADEELLRWEFEEGGGNLVLDSSGNSNNGFVNNGRWQTGAAAQWGTFGFDFDENNDWIDSLGGIDLSGMDQVSISTWSRRDSNGGENTIFQLFGANFNIELVYEEPGTDLYLDFVDTNNATDFFTIDGSGLSNSVYYHHVITVDFNDSRILYYQDNVLLFNQTNPTGINKPSAPVSVRVGADSGNGGDFDGDMDEFRIYNFLVNSSQINELFTTNSITIPQEGGSGGEGNETGGGGENETEINGTQSFDIISTFAPSEGTVVSSPFDITATLNTEATCDLYIDNEFVFENVDTLAFTNTVNDLSPGNHTYFIYCSTLDAQNILLFDITNLTTIQVSQPAPSDISFVYQSNDLDVNAHPLFMVTPCLDPGIVIPGLGRSKYSMINNPDVYISPVINGVASFTLPPTTHEFCLINGVAQYNNANGFSDIWFVNKADHQEDIGSFSVPSNVTQTFFIGIDESDIYSVSDPKWWGTSWTSIIGAIIGLIIGIGLIAIGVIMRVPQAMVIGGLVAAISLGFQVGSLVLGVLT